MPATTDRFSLLPEDLLALSDPAPEELYGAITARYDVVSLPLEVGAEKFNILVVRDTNTLLDLISPEAFSRDERLPYWADLWTSSLDLASWMLEERAINGKAVLELGSGVGLAGIAAARAGARVMLTDYEPDALLFARYNAARNLPDEARRHRVRFVPMDWRAPNLNLKFDMIIGADIVYERRNFDPILSLLQSHLLPGGQVLLTEPDRTIGQAFLTAARGTSFAVSQSFSTVDRESKKYRISRVLMTAK